MHVYKNLDDLHKVISKEVLPKDYGGNDTSLDILYGKSLYSNLKCRLKHHVYYVDKWKMFMKYKNSWLIELGNKRSNEALRTGPPLDSDMFGMCGSFRKLDLD